MPEVHVGIGSNVDPKMHIRHALDHLSERFGNLIVSPVYRNPPVGFEGDDFLNLVVRFETALPATQLVDALHEIERLCGRQQAETRLASRSLDMDLLLYGDDIIDAPGLRVPREEILDYAFMLRPLSDIAGDRIHPELGRTFADLWQEYGDRETPLVEVEIY